MKWHSGGIVPAGGQGGNSIGVMFTPLSGLLVV